LTGHDDENEERKRREGYNMMMYIDMTQLSSLNSKLGDVISSIDNSPKKLAGIFFLFNFFNDKKF
jgi:hypothetical protein